ncbi:MAG: TIGR00730 family Rossman fold protein [Erysipelotrichaceae bacterium]|nr:TIGR00730 family Rossman fold protein [Erysipelotrichaceae bacterium]
MNICVYGAASSQISSSYLEAGTELGRQIALNGYGLVFGGGGTGMMGAAAGGALSEGGVIIGIYPSFFDGLGKRFEPCTELIVTETMRERKMLMEEKSEAFVVTAGGIGTLEEFFEILTLKQLGRHHKPVCILNTDGCYDDLDHLIHKLVRDRFMKPEDAELYFISDSVDEIMNRINRALKA